MMLFDQYSRYKTGAELVRLNSTSAQTRIVDIGCGADCLLAEFVGKGELTFVDPLLSVRMEGGNKRADFPRKGCTAIAEGFSAHASTGATYDCVVAIDTFEHIPQSNRDEFLGALLALSTDVIVIGFPSCDTPHAKAVDEAVDQGFITHFGHSYPWLQEHRDFGLPSCASARALFESHGWQTRVLNHGNPEWLTSLLPRIVCLWEEPELRELAFAISEIFNAEFTPFDFGGVVGYRQFIVARKGMAPILPTIDDEAVHSAARRWEGFLKRVDNLLLAEMLGNTKKFEAISHK